MRLVRIAVPVATLLICGALIADRITVDTMARLPAQLAGITPWQWSVAATLTAVSLWSVGQYDAVAHGYLRTGIPRGQARIAGAIGIAIGQTLGFGLLTGALARWRMLPTLTGPAALRLSTFVAVTFLMAWVVITSVACLLLPAPPWTAWLAWPGVVAGLALPIVLFRYPRLRLGRRSLALPNLRQMGGIVGWALVDTLAAAGALFVMLPEGSIAFAALYPLFLVAMGAALMSNTPGGVGPFEVLLLAALPGLGAEAVLAAIVAYRIVYYAVPATLAALALLHPLPRPTPAPALRPADARGAPRSEVAVVRQNGGAILRNADAALALWPTGQTVTLLADPVAGTPRAALDLLMRSARSADALPVIYKCSARMAATARGAGWSVLHLADDAVIDLPGYSVHLPARRTLRRKLRSADRAGVTVRAGGPLPYAALARIDRDWQSRNGPPRGGSMGRYCPDYLVDQWVGCAYVGGRPVAFVTAHRARDEWCLDLMRSDSDAPDGTMHTLVQCALDAARAAGAHRFNLAATPACPDPVSPVWRWAAMQVVARAGGPGLRQFKSAFAPRWVPRYAAAPGPMRLGFGLADIARAIHRPVPLDLTGANQPHNERENYEVASSRVA